MTKFKDFIYAILAGACIALGGVVYLSVENKVVGAFLFSTGLFMVLTLGYNLFIGKVGYVFLNDKRTYLPFLGIVYAGNFVGSVIVAELIRLTRVGAKVQEAATVLVTTKLTDSYLSLFILGLFCNFFVVNAVHQYKNNPHEFGKYMGIFMSIMVFILAGFEHSIADMFYFQMARAWSLHTVICLLVITLGNIVGGVIIPSLAAMKDK
ncbi:MAG: formate/nitrite transporter family protein [Finegoldia sp.]|nr:formate/nitrite transporter family protein [Finegoldia sp.]